MTRHIWLIALIAFTLTSLSCSTYFKRKECEKTNWYDYGKKIAMKGERLSSDSFIKECQKAEALVKHDELDLGFKEGMSLYCKPEGAYQVGREGDNFNFSFCDKNVDKLRSEHNRGLEDYCTPEGGYRAGTEGKKYKDNCPKDLETAFLKRYRTGRSIFLQGEVRKKQKEIIDIESQIARKEREQRDLRFRIANLPRARVYSRQSDRDGRRRRSETYIEDVETDETRMKRDELERDIRSVDRDIERLESRKKALRNEIVDLRTEINSLRAY